MNGKHILIIDDDLPFSEMLSEVLHDEGAEVTVAHNGMEGIQKATEKHPDLITCDIMMPQLPGVEVLKKLRTTDWGATIPFLLLSNMNKPDSLATIDQTMMRNTECLLKTDWTLDDLAEKIKGLLSTPNQ